MRDYRFYEEFGSKADKRRGISQGNVVALCITEPTYLQGGKVMQGAVSAIYSEPNSAIAYNSVNLDYLRDKCKRISEAKARTIHPRLFQRLDEKD